MDRIERQKLSAKGEELGGAHEARRDSAAPAARVHTREDRRLDEAGRGYSELAQLQPSSSPHQLQLMTSNFCGKQELLLTLQFMITNEGRVYQEPGSWAGRSFDTLSLAWKFIEPQSIERAHSRDRRLNGAQLDGCKPASQPAWQRAPAASRWATEFVSESSTSPRERERGAPGRVYISSLTRSAHPS